MASPSRPKPFTQAFPSSPNQSWLEYPSPVHPARSTRKLYQNAPSDRYGPRSTMSKDGSDMCGFARCDAYSQTFDVNNPFASPESGDSLSPISPRTAMLHSILKSRHSKISHRNPKITVHAVLLRPCPAQVVSRRAELALSA